MKTLKILIITQGVSRLVRPLLESGHQVVGVLESMPRNFDGLKRNSLFILMLKKIYGILKRNEFFLEDFCKKNEIKYNFIWKNNTNEVSDWIKNLNPDLIVIFSMSQLLKGDIIRIPPLGVINLHTSFLPSYRGPNPDFWQYYDTELNPGATVHYVNEGEDTGDIIYQERVNVPLGTKSHERLDKLIGELGVSLVLRSIDSIAQGTAVRVPQPTQSPTIRARNLKFEEHSQIIDWKNWPIERVWHVLRGTEQWLNAIPQPTGLMDGQRWSIEEYERTEEALGTPGQIGENKNKKCVFTRDGLIYIKIDFDIKKIFLRILRR